MLAALERGLQLLLFGLALSKLPFAFVNDILLQSDSIEFCVKLRAVGLESICARSVISEELSLRQCLIGSTILLQGLDLLSLLLLAGATLS